MNDFLSEGFLLTTPAARTLYNDFARDMPIFDFHCHLSPREIYEDKRYASISEVWLGGDHYKWRLMRQAGVSEKYITGDAGDYERFERFCEIMPLFVGNPMYEWAHLELRRYFGTDKIICRKNAKSIYDEANEILKGLSARKMIEQNNVRAIFTTDDPTDDLAYHRLLSNEGYPVAVLPTFRPDKAISVERDSFRPWCEKLKTVCGCEIDSLQELCAALVSRIEYFDSLGCVCSDHALGEVMYEASDEHEAAAIFEKAKKEPLAREELAKYKGYLLVFLGRQYAKRGWAQQYHIGPLRDNSSRMFARLGGDAGYDAINDAPVAVPLSRLLDAMDKTGELPKTVLYTLDPAKNEILAALMNCFQADGLSGKIQFGSGWWFNDQRDGMRRQLTALMSVGLVSAFIGMLTDSRSFLSFTRHEYFRRLLCCMLGELVEEGAYPRDMETLGAIVQNICYNNAKNYFSK